MLLMWLYRVSKELEWLTTQLLYFSQTMGVQRVRETTGHYEDTKPLSGKEAPEPQHLFMVLAYPPELRRGCSMSLTGIQHSWKF